jgi:hypothetical protein
VQEHQKNLPEDEPGVIAEGSSGTPNQRVAATRKYTRCSEPTLILHAKRNYSVKRLALEINQRDSALQLIDRPAGILHSLSLGAFARPVGSSGLGVEVGPSVL